MSTSRAHDGPDDDAPPRGAPGRTSLRDLADATPAHRDRYVDLLRAAAILTVVLGHWLVSAVTVEDGRLDGVNVLDELSWTHPLTWLFQVMPVVFLVGGYANAASWATHRRRGGTAPAWVLARALRLLRPAVIFLAALVGGYAVALAAGVDPVVVRRSVWAAGLSLWFLVVYLAVVSLAPLLLAWHARQGLVGTLPLVGVVAAGDAARVLTGSDDAAAASYLLAWVAMHQLGAAWRDGTLTRTRAPAVTLAAGGLLTAVVLTAWGPYGVTMVGAAPPPDLTNTAPPTLALLALAAGQTGVLLLLRPVADRWLTRRRVWIGVVAVNGVAFTLYLWHMVPVVVAGAALVATGLFPEPAVGSAQWWWLRPPWFAVLAVLLAAIVAVAGRSERRSAPSAGETPSARVVGAGVVACVGGLAGLGFGGTDGVLPTVAGVPAAELGLVAGGFALLSWAGRRAQ
ncbi:MAG: acyltransferase [Actinotalea sp.]|nr:acyltransferase [Actinotalea sp.]